MRRCGPTRQESLLNLGCRNSVTFGSLNPVRAALACVNNNDVVGNHNTMAVSPRKLPKRGEPLACMRMNQEVLIIPARRAPLCF